MGHHHFRRSLRMNAMNEYDNDNIEQAFKITNDVKQGCLAPTLFMMFQYVTEDLDDKDGVYIRWQPVLPKAKTFARPHEKPRRN